MKSGATPSGTGNPKKGSRAAATSNRKDVKPLKNRWEESIPFAIVEDVQDELLVFKHCRDLHDLRESAA